MRNNRNNCSCKSEDLCESTIENDVFTCLSELYLSTFKWEGLPDSVNKKYLERKLFEDGKVGFFKDSELGYLTLSANDGGDFNEYGEPTTITLTGSNGFSDTRKNNKDVVVIYDRKNKVSMNSRIRYFAKRIANVEKTMDLNVYGQRFPVLLKCNKKQELSIKTLMRKYDRHEKMVFVDESLDLEKVTVINLNSPFIADKLEETRRKLWNEALSLIGIENNYSEKNERLTVGEVLISNGLAIANRNSRLNERKEAVDKINKMFELEINVDVSNVSVTDIDPTIKVDDVEELGGVGGE